MSTNKRPTDEQRRLEADLSDVLGRHVSERKGQLLLFFTALVCMIPTALGLRLWNSIPAIIETGLVGPGGEDDSLPRWALVFLIPGLFCLLNVINHLQLRRFQTLRRVPPRHTRLLGRWGFPLVDLLLCAWMIPASAARRELTGPTAALWVLGWAVMVLGGALWDCPQDSRLALPFPACRKSAENFRAIHCAASVSALTASALLALSAALFPAAQGGAAAAALLLSAAILAPFLYARRLDRSPLGK